jgi:hypothetical protein
MGGMLPFMILIFEDGRSKNVFAHMGQIKIVYLRAVP